jgi:hypothetical protein
MHEYLREFAKNLKLFRDFHQGPIMCRFMKKTDTKKSHTTVPSMTQEFGEPNVKATKYSGDTNGILQIPVSIW